MARSVLVGYASEHGSTRSIAERIGAQLARNGSNVTVLSVSYIVDVGHYDAVVLGSAVHGGAWLEPAVELVRRYGAQLAVQPLWLFSVGMSGALRGPLRPIARSGSQKVIAPSRAALRPRDHHVFTGVVCREHLPERGRWILGLLGCRYGDHRNWPEVDTWARTSPRRYRPLPNSIAATA